MSDTKIDLSLYCAQYDPRAIFNEPFFIEDWEVGTDGHVLVMIPHSGAISTPRAPNVRNVVDPAHAYAKDREWNPFPKDLKTVIVTCTECKGSGLKSVQCKLCEGTGREECSLCGHEDECTRCGGSGVTGAHGQCDSCSGTKVEEEYDHVQLHGLYIRGCYAKKISYLPNVEYGDVSSCGTIIPFRFTGGMGVVMSVRLDDWPRPVPVSVSEPADREEFQGDK